MWGKEIWAYAIEVVILVLWVFVLIELVNHEPKE